LGLLRLDPAYSELLQQRLIDRAVELTWTASTIPQLVTRSSERQFRLHSTGIGTGANRGTVARMRRLRLSANSDPATAVRCWRHSKTSTG
jgi:hypothetical protein